MTQPQSPEAALEQEIGVEQAFVDRAYQNLDSSRHKYRAQQRQVESAGAHGTPQARTERDAMAAYYGDQAARLEQIEDRLVFGRLDTTSDETLYIGRAGLSEPDGSRLLVDWRAPAAMPFYQATPVDPNGVVRRRHIATHLRKVRTLEDELLDTDAESVGQLQFQGEGALMSALAQARSGQMADIVATIQAEQDAIIRAKSDGVLVVQGGPGTGKTAVALHRAAYLLYAERKRLERSGVLIVGPSKILLRYIEQVLPSLGETGVVSVTLGDLVPGISAQATDPIDVAASKGQLAWIGTLRQAVRNLQRLPVSDEVLTFGSRQAVLTRDMVAAARSRARRTGKPHNQARDGFATELMNGLVDQLVGEDTESDTETAQWWLEEIRGSAAARRAINLCWMPTSPEQLLRRLYAKPELLSAANQGLSAEDLQLVRRDPESPWTVSDVPLLDELDELLGHSNLLRQQEQRHKEAELAAEVSRAQAAIRGQQLGGGLVNAELLAAQTLGHGPQSSLSERARSDREWAYGHIVVDEAQDLSPMAWHSLLRRCPSRSFTVVGDLDQRRGYRRPAGWFEALGPVARGLDSEQVLTISYRTPQQVMSLAQDVMAELGYPVRYPVVSARAVPGALAATRVDSLDGLAAAVQTVIAEETAALEQEVGAGAGRIGVIVGQERTAAWDADQAGVRALDQQVTILSVPAAKGLEFDVTILVEPAEILADGPGDLFVAMTRSTRRLHTVHVADLPTVWHSALTQELR